MKKFNQNYLKESKLIIDKIDKKKINKVIDLIYKVKKNLGRIFFLGVGGSAANCSHAVNDFRKIVGIEAYTPTDNVAELTARINDEGWENSLTLWLKNNNIDQNDGIFVMSVGGGNIKKNISVNIINAIDFALKKKSKVFGIVGRKDGYAFAKGDCVIVVPEVDRKFITPYSESFQTVIWHCLVSSPELQQKNTKW